MSHDDIFDVPVEEVKPTVNAKSVEIKDELSSPVAKKFAFVGVGACGNRIVEGFWKRGYRRCWVGNTASVDLTMIDDAIPKMKFTKDEGQDGAGKSPDVAKEIVMIPVNREALRMSIGEAIGKNFDYIFVCAGLGGGTGSGAGPEIMKICKEYAASVDQDPERVGCIISLPQASEGPRVNQNALTALKDFYALKPTPMILIDNHKIAVQKDTKILKHNQIANEDTVKFIHACNQLSATPAQIAFDSADFGKVLDAGLLVFGMSAINEWKNGEEAVTKAVLETFKTATLAEVETSSATQAACLFVAGEEVLDQFSSSSLTAACDMLVRHMGKGAMVHRGIYPNERLKDKLMVYTMIGGLKPAKETIEVLAKAAQIEPSHPLATFLGLS